MTARVFFLSTTILFASQASLAQTQAEFDFAGQPDSSGPARDLWATHYFVHQAASTSSGIPFRDKNGKILSDNVQPRDWCLAAIEGTVQVPFQNLPKTLNYAGTGTKSQVDCAAVLKISPIKNPWIASTGKSHFVTASGPFGDGVKGNKLVPYRTIAVDKTVLPYGIVLFVPSARGAEIQLPSVVS